MTRHRILSLLLSLALLLGLTGCGEEVYDLTAEERSVIVNYAAHLMLKYHISGTEGYRFVLELPEDEEEAEADAGEGEEDETAEEAEQETDGETAASEPETEEEPPEETEQEQLSASELFARALGLEEMGIVYTGAEFAETYETVFPEAGFQMMALHFTLENLSEETREAAILTASPVFRAALNGGDAVTADMTILANDLSTYMGTLEPGESEDLVLLFQIPADARTELDSLEMQLIVGAKTTRIILQ